MKSLKEIFASKDTEIDEAQVQLDSITQENADLTTELETLKADHISKDETIATLETEKLTAVSDAQESAEAIANLTEQLEAATVDKETFDAQVSAGVATAVSALGIDPVEEIADEDAIESQDILAAWNKLDGDAKQEFYNENAREIKLLAKQK